MKFCWKCGAKLRGTNPAFCSECGVKLDDGTNTIQEPQISSFNNNYEEAKRLYSIKDYNQALSYINSAIANDNANYEYYNLKAKILICTNKFSDALNVLDLSFNIKENLEALFQKAYCFYIQNNIEKAIKFFFEYENKYLNNAEFYWKLAYFYCVNNDKNNAINACDKAININRTCGEAYTYRAIANFLNGKTKDIMEDLENSFKYLNTNNEEYYVSKLYYASNFILMTNGCLKDNPKKVFTPMNEALSQLKEASDFNRKNVLFYNRGFDIFKEYLLMATNENYFNIDVRDSFGSNVSKLWQDITDICLKISPNDSRIYKFKGDLYGRGGFHEKAIYYFDKVLTSDEPDFRVIGYKAVSLMELGKYQEAENAFKQMYLFLEDELKKDSRNIYLMREKAVTLIQLGRRRDALSVYDEIEKINPHAEFLAQDKARLGFR